MEEPTTDTVYDLAHHESSIAQRVSVSNRYSRTSWFRLPLGAPKFLLVRISTLERFSVDPFVFRLIFAIKCSSIIAE